MTDSEGTSSCLRTKKMTIPNKLLICGKFSQEFLKNQLEYSKKYFHNFFCQKLRKFQKKQKSHLSLLKNSSESTLNVWELYNFVEVILNLKMKETTKSEECFLMTWLKEEESKPSLTLALKTLPPILTINSRYTTQRVDYSHLATSINNLLIFSKFFRKKWDLSMKNQSIWQIDCLKMLSFQRILR